MSKFYQIKAESQERKLHPTEYWTPDEGPKNPLFTKKKKRVLPFNPNFPNYTHYPMYGRWRMEEIYFADQARIKEREKARAKTSKICETKEM